MESEMITKNVLDIEEEIRLHGDVEWRSKKNLDDHILSLPWDENTRIVGHITSNTMQKWGINLTIFRLRLRRCQERRNLLPQGIGNSSFFNSHVNEWYLRPKKVSGLVIFLSLRDNITYFYILSLLDMGDLHTSQLFHRGDVLFLFSQSSHRHR